ncbi:cytochrome-c oxidase, cbb3-type subunit III [Rhodovulum sulfidophilum]|uniref:Cbb3-type cytochrome c oxidase subunit n=2 Tax=Rhodovulum sulfidophilum TaxID=35806 RepID=A0ABS1RTR8_RHOSU|nr:cytochrome-c oxidase, cbb3-type subunit III [Rhodovulum sulfidophilum]ANB33640.1 cytochrome C oxidase Cbb3 [Rhodovulum sulfidophilum DSM 1374]ANB37461.1 cytochrome C oxidase Cbb3 [Rhodovulum sulfidophilum]MBL3560702.1 cytochrome-c oxidase, cbb3-type subunit III [Rhodovulum sulfidophilum]MBL3564681.1 cytochrome-c oxidase, cbb3-type subunit III [Rhodovulum sulfidophilum]MBL3573875.1 cytochrome-c oxidase, cbb3-type subunit III [Rhodovulum sulfidophilum]
MSSSDHHTKPGEVGTTGHSWDGIEELNNPLPRWWLWTFYACIAFALIYSVLYPAWPLVKGATPGLLGYSTRAAVEVEIKEYEDRNAELSSQLAAASMEDPAAIEAEPALYNYAVQGGASVFRTNCAQCHGSGAAGVQGQGYPSLLDDDWLWGGTLEDIYYTVTNGVRNEDNMDARWSQMPSFGTDGLLTSGEIDQVVQYVRQISGQEHDAALASQGETVFLDNCAACHGEDGRGDRNVGAPNLTDAIWLYGGDVATLTETVTKARFGVMPTWKERLSETERKAVAVYVHQLGGGE